MLTITQEVQALVRDRHETLRLSAQTASDCQALCTKLRAELVRLRQTIEAGHECLASGQHKLRRAKTLDEW